ncbi:LRR receptor kinase BAK1 [Glycine soja]
MACSVHLLLLLTSLLALFFNPTCVYGNDELRTLLDLKSSLDPEGHFLSSWTIDGTPCGGSFEGVACNEKGQVANVSLQGKGLSGKLSPAIAGLKHLTGLYLHYNSLYGEIPRELANLTELSDLYLNVNHLSGEIPPEIGMMESLQEKSPLETLYAIVKTILDKLISSGLIARVLQLCYNQLTGSIPTQLSDLKKLSVLALQSNQFAGAIPASLGDLGMLMRLDLSSNNLFGSIPTKLADLPLLQVLDVHNNTLSGNVPPALKRLEEGFVFEHNVGLCGVGFSSLKACTASDHVNLTRPEPYGAGVGGLSRDIPETANVKLPCNTTQCRNPSRSKQAASITVGIVLVTIAVSAIGIFTFTMYRRRKQKLGSTFDISEGRLSTDQAKSIYRKNGSPLVSLEYSNGWDPLADGKNVNGDRQDMFQSFRFNLEEVESATQYFSELNLLGKSNFSATYKGVLRDGSVVAVKSISKTSCKSDEAEFLKGLNILTSLRNENLVRLRGFCCSRGRGECFLVYDFVSNGNLSCYLDVKEGDGEVLEWSTRVSIAKGIAKGIAYLHAYKAKKQALVHQNISAEKVLIDQRYNPLLSDSGLYKLLTNDIVFSALKGSAAKGYLAPEYTTTGRFTEKSDVYAFGVLLFQILTGKQKITSAMRLAAESFKFPEFIDPNLHGKFFEYEAAKLARMALLCSHESPFERPSMEAIVQELGNCSSCL